jgi:hypothetical protein
VDRIALGDIKDVDHGKELKGQKTKGRKSTGVRRQ